MDDGTKVRIYPTVTKGLVMVEILNSELPSYKIELPDIKGINLKSENVETDKQKLDLDKYSVGIHFNKIINKNTQTFISSELLLSNRFKYS
jgi:hypothetical protein